MDKNNYNVDDILTEIKSRKSRSKTQLQDQHGQKAEAPPVRQEPPVTARPLQDITQAPAQQRQQAPVQQRRPAPPQQRQPVPPQQDTARDAEEPPQPDRRRVLQQQGTRPPRQRPDSETLKFKMPEDTPNTPKNPLDFGGHVRSIEERAKIRSMGNTRPIPKLDFNAGAVPVSDGDKDAGRTRVLPNVSGMRDMQTSDIRKLDFEKIAEERGSFYDDNDEDDTHTSHAIDYSEYNSASDKRDVQIDIAKIKLWLFIRIAATFVLTVILFMFTMWGKYENVPLLPKALEPLPETMRAYLLTCTIISILIALVNSSAVGGGLIGLFRMHANSDTLPACAALASVGQGVVCVANPGMADPSQFNLYFVVSAAIMLFNGLGKIMMINRIMTNFRTLSSDLPKKAALTVKADDFCREFYKNETRRPSIVYSAKAGFFTDFLGLSYFDKYDVGVNRIVSPACILASVIVCAVTYILAGSMISAVSALTAVLCVCAAFSSTFIENVPLSKLAKKLEPYGGMVSGVKAVDNFCDTKAIVLSENDLFPLGNVQMHGIKAFSQGRIDEAILDAASVLCGIDGALGPVFLDMIGGNKKLLKRVDNIVFENDMGISAWVDQRRVLIGNRKLMMNHGITLPPEVMQQKSAQVITDSEPLFLSNSGEASAQFSVSYHIDEDLAVELDHLGGLGRLLIVYTTDANITAEKIWELYGYPLEHIRILPAKMHEAYQEMSKPRDKAAAEIVYTGKAAAIVKAILSCISAKPSIVIATVMQLAGIAIGYAFVTYMAFMGTISSLNITEILAYQFFWFAAIFIVQKVRQS